MNFLYSHSLELKNKNHDDLLKRTLNKTHLHTIEILKKEFGEKIECNIINDYLNNLDQNNLKNIVLKASIKKLQKNYQENIDLILKRKLNKDDFYGLIMEKEEKGIDISIKNITILLSKLDSYQEIIKILEKYKNIIDFDNGIFYTILKSKITIEEFYFIFKKYNKTKINLDQQSILFLLYKANNINDKLNIIKDFKLKIINEDITKHLIESSNNFQEALNIVEKYNINSFSIKLINELLKKAKGINEIEDVLKLNILNKKLNLKSISILLFKIHEIEILEKILIINDFELDTLEDYKNNYFINKIFQKFNFNSIEDLYFYLENILINKNINEDNWQDFL